MQEVAQEYVTVKYVTSAHLSRNARGSLGIWSYSRKMSCGAGRFALRHQPPTSTRSLWCLHKRTEPVRMSVGVG